MNKPQENYTVIVFDLKDPTMMRLEYFLNRDKMRELLIEYAEKGIRCVVVPGVIDDIDYQVDYKKDGKTINTIHFEDEPNYRPLFMNILRDEVQ